MRFRLVTITAALCTLLVGVPAAAGGSDSTAVRSQRNPVPVLHFSFDNGESLRPGTRVQNVAGRGEGRVLTADGGRLMRVEGLRRRGAKFPAACGNCGRAIIEAGDRRAFDPGRRGFAYGAAIKMTAAEGSHDSNIMQKGFFRQQGGQYKLQIDFGKPSCVVNGRAGRLKARSTLSVANDRWHTVTCKRTRGAVTLRVDGIVRDRVRGATGRLANAAPIRVGGLKVATARNDQYHGRLDSVFVKIKPTRR
jgi:hypothetical protein